MHRTILPVPKACHFQYMNTSQMTRESSGWQWAWRRVREGLVGGKYMKSESAWGFTHTGCEDTGSVGLPLALRTHLHSKPGPLLTCSETLDTVPNLLSASFPNSMGLQKGLCFQRYANHLACSPALSTMALLLTY